MVHSNIIRYKRNNYRQPRATTSLELKMSLKVFKCLMFFDWYSKTIIAFIISEHSIRLVTRFLLHSIFTIMYPQNALPHQHFAVITLSDCNAPERVYP